MTIGMLEFGLILVCLLIMQAYLGLRMFREWSAAKRADATSLVPSSDGNAREAETRPGPSQGASKTEREKPRGFGARPRENLQEPSSGIDPRDDLVLPERKRGLASFASSA